MNYVGIDPSFSKTGLCIIDLENKRITFKSISPPGTNKTYADAINRSIYIERALYNTIPYPAVVLIEEPLISSMMASRLGILSGVVMSGLIKNNHIHKIYTTNPISVTQLNSVAPNKGELTKKQLSLRIANDILSYFETQDFNIIITNDKLNKDGTPKQRKISHDEAEALILALLLLKQEEKLAFEHWTEIYKINKGFYTKSITINQYKEEGINE